MPLVFTAPWSRQLKWLTSITCFFLVGVSIAMQLNAQENPPLMYRIGIVLPLIVLFTAALFAIRGYRVEHDQLLILRPGWRSRIPLSDFQSAEFTPNAMAGSIRLFGNGGLFGFIGLFRNNELGRYRAFVTDTSRTVVIRHGASTVVISPDDPERLVRSLNSK
ncbi:PH domain-containing protein [Microbulbifer aggregans]|uniref:PH domain-containing protein n=1 Tax=Microbulbifer aggregans TaxID=1769779 RepID=UPI001CFD9F07|nr:PH domain-containing protein [Microbulbifer aggregans]